MSYDCVDGIQKNEITSISGDQKISLFIDVILKNLGFAILILLGFIFYNISTIVLIMYNGFMWGISFSVTSCYVGYYTTTKLVITHIVLELIWIYCFAKYSFLLTENFVHLLNRNTSVEEVWQKAKTNKYYLKLGFTLLFLAAVIESFLSDYILKILNFF
ncbi:hypothetical protein CAPN010_07990 [Capnocytophaga cynodegmi]|nr:hypothetical protein CAPN010_07990 [Capnocytophaga cynodegmi]